MEPPERFPRVLNGLPREYFEDPSGVLKTNPRGHKLRGFLAKGLAEDVAEGFVVNIPGMSSTHW